MLEPNSPGVPASALALFPAPTPAMKPEVPVVGFLCGSAGRRSWAAAAIAAPIAGGIPPAPGRAPAGGITRCDCVIDVTAIAGLLPIEGGILATLAPVLVRRGGLGGGLSKVGSESSSVSVLSNPTLPKLDIECRGGGCGACTAVSAGPIVEVLLAGEVGAAKCAGLRATAGLDLRFAGFAAIGGGLATAGVPVPLATGVVSLDGTGFLFEDSEGELAEAMVAAPKFALVVVLRGGGGGGPSV